MRLCPECYDKLKDVPNIVKTGVEDPVLGEELNVKNAKRE